MLLSRSCLQVWKARKAGSLQTVAVKLITKHGKNENDVRNLRQEIDILRKLRHPNIIEMLDAFETKTDFCVVTEFAQGAASNTVLVILYSSTAACAIALPHVFALLLGAAAQRPRLSRRRRHRLFSSLQASCFRSWRTTAPGPRTSCRAWPASWWPRCTTSTPTASSTGT